MKRRKFLGTAAGSAFGIPIVVQGSSFYGTPTTSKVAALPTAESLLRLPLVQSGVPQSMYDWVLKIGDLWHNVLTKTEINLAFRSDPDKFLKDHGIPESSLYTTLECNRP